MLLGCAQFGYSINKFLIDVIVLKALQRWTADTKLSSFFIFKKKTLGERIDLSVSMCLKLTKPFRKSIERFQLGLEQEAYDTERIIWKVVCPTLIDCSRNQTVIAFWNISICPHASSHASLEIKKSSEIEHLLVVLAHLPLCQYDI